MGIDIHEWRRFYDKEDPNPAARRATEYSAYGVPAYKGKRSRPKIGWAYQRKHREAAYKEGYLNDNPTQA